MIVKVTFLDLNNERFTILFGNSYKNWFTQFEEYLFRKVKWWDDKIIMNCEFYRIYDVSKSMEKWVGYGGLKWCLESAFQDELDHEAKGLNYRHARQYKDMCFGYDANKFYKIKKALKVQLRHLESSNPEEIREQINKYKTNKHE